MDSGRTRHGEDSVSADPKHFERFIKILNDHHVRAYICGHTHDTSVEKVRGILANRFGPRPRRQATPDRRARS